MSNPKKIATQKGTARLCVLVTIKSLLWILDKKMAKTNSTAEQAVRIMSKVAWDQRVDRCVLFDKIIKVRLAGVPVALGPPTSKQEQPGK